MAIENQLALARRWFEQLGGKVSDVPLDLSVGRDLPSIAIDFGLAKLNAVVDKGGTLVILQTLKLSPEVVIAAKNMGRENQERVLLLLKNTLMENQRMLWALMPPTCTAIGELEAIQVMERMRISEEEVATFNRFQDAIQELSTLRVKVQVLFESTLGAVPPARLPPGTRGTTADSGIYR